MTLKVRTCRHGLLLHLKVLKCRMANIKKLSYHRLLEILTQFMASGFCQLQLLKWQTEHRSDFQSRETENCSPIARQPPRGSAWVEKLWNLESGYNLRTKMQVERSAAKGNKKLCWNGAIILVWLTNEKSHIWKPLAFQTYSICWDF